MIAPQDPVRVAAVQFGVGSDVADNLATCLRMIDEAAAQGARIIVLPEFSNHVSWYDDRAHARRMAITTDGPFATAVADRARTHGAYIMLNAVVARADGRTTGSNLLFDPDGALVATSDKQVLMGSERDHIDPAVEAGPIVETPLGRLGMYSCMDGVICETPRGLAVRGAQILLNSLNSFALDEASLHIPVRAAENKVWVVAANKIGPLVPADRLEAVSAGLGVPAHLLHGAGESQIVAPDGTVVAKAPRTGEAVVVADIAVARADDKRRPDGTDVMAARRPAVYGPLAEEARARIQPPGRAELPAAVVVPQATGEAAIDEAAELVRGAATTAELIVLPELLGQADPTLPDEAVGLRCIKALSAALGGTDALAVTSVVEDGGHVGIVVGADGVRARQVQLHRSERHAGWQHRLGDVLTVHEVDGYRLAVVVGDDAIFPETMRLAALVDADVVAAPVTIVEAWETLTGLPERSGENRVALVVAGGTSSLVADPSADFSLWAPDRGPFTGVISAPDVQTMAGAGLLHAVVHPARSANRAVSKGTDLVGGRPWNLLDGIVARTR